jgi:hypothetical protein
MAQKKKKKTKKPPSTGQARPGLRRQQIIMGVIGIFIILSMLISLIRFY